jgi:glycine C-acetyltransferase
MEEAWPRPFDDTTRSASASDFIDSSDASPRTRWARHEAFWTRRLAAGLDPYHRTLLDMPGPSCTVLTRGRERLSGVNFSTMDHLSLGSHPMVREAAIAAIRQWGFHAGGPAHQQSMTAPLMTLEERLGDVLGYRDVTIFPSGWAAGYGTLRTLAAPDDHVIIDAGASAALLDGAIAATRNVWRVPTYSPEAAAERLARIRQDDGRTGILVVTESLLGTASTAPDIRSLRALSQRHGATLIVNVTHDFGATGDGGLGFLGDQALMGDVDLILGSFSPVFASSGGFVASNIPGVRQALRTFASPLVFSTALGPVQASAINAALTIVRSREGAERRARLARNIERLRTGLAARAFRVLGQPGPIVPVWLGGTGDARQMTSAVMAHGAQVNLIEHPSVGRDSARWGLSVMADHSDADTDILISAAVAARESLPPPQTPCESRTGRTRTDQDRLSGRHDARGHSDMSFDDDIGPPS